MVDIIEDSEDPNQASRSRGRPGNVNVGGLDWSNQGSDLEVPLFSININQFKRKIKFQNMSFLMMLWGLILYKDSETQKHSK